MNKRLDIGAEKIVIEILNDTTESDCITPNKMDKQKKEMGRKNYQRRNMREMNKRNLNSEEFKKLQKKITEQQNEIDMMHNIIISTFGNSYDKKTSIIALPECKNDECKSFTMPDNFYCEPCYKNIKLENNEMTYEITVTKCMTKGCNKAASPLYFYCRDCYIEYKKRRQNTGKKILKCRKCENITMNGYAHCNECYKEYISKKNDKNEYHDHDKYYNGYILKCKNCENIAANNHTYCNECYEKYISEKNKDTTECENDKYISSKNKPYNVKKCKTCNKNAAYGYKHCDECHYDYLINRQKNSSNFKLHKCKNLECNNMVSMEFIECISCYLYKKNNGIDDSDINKEEKYKKISENMNIKDDYYDTIDLSSIKSNETEIKINIKTQNPHFDENLLDKKSMDLKKSDHDANEKLNEIYPHVLITPDMIINNYSMNHEKNSTIFTNRCNNEYTSSLRASAEPFIPRNISDRKYFVPTSYKISCAN